MLMGRVESAAPIGTTVADWVISAPPTLVPRENDTLSGLFPPGRELDRRSRSLDQESRIAGPDVDGVDLQRFAQAYPRLTRPQ